MAIEPGQTAVPAVQQPQNRGRWHHPDGPNVGVETALPAGVVGDAVPGARDRRGFLHPDGSLRLEAWAADIDGPGQAGVQVDTGARARPMAGSDATGQPLLSNGHLGIDLIRVGAGGGFAPHTHPGDHLLIVIAGEGTVTYDGRIYPTRAGQVYLIEGAVPHAVGAITDHVLLAVGVPHRAVDAPDRQALVEYESVRAHLGDIVCLICDVTAKAPDRLADLGCSHCPSRFSTT